MRDLLKLLRPVERQAEAVDEETGEVIEGRILRRDSLWFEIDDDRRYRLVRLSTVWKWGVVILTFFNVLRWFCG